MSQLRPIILCFVSYYLPGYRSGGPVRTIANWVEHLGNEFDIRIVTRDRDALDKQPYAGVEVDAWNTVGKAQVFYASRRTINLRGIAGLMRETPHDVLYLNSFFMPKFSTLPLLIRYLGLVPRKPTVMAPRGQFSDGAITLKAWKKRPYVTLIKLIGWHADLQWQASSAYEKEDIQRNLPIASDKITIAPDLPPVVAGNDAKVGGYAERKPGPLRIVFLSRISPMKNLDFLLRVLGRVPSAVELSIFGPLREPDYWARCEAIISELPANLEVRYEGEVPPPKVLETFVQFDLFAFPTRGENYGHVVLEALTAGTPVLISDQTPWQASSNKAVEVLPLDDMDAWVNEIDRWARYENHDFQGMRLAAKDYAREYLKTNKAVKQNRALFYSMVSG